TGDAGRGAGGPGRRPCPPMDIRLLSAHDAAALERVAPGVFDDPLDPAATREFLSDPRHHIAVAIDDGIVVGFVSAVHYAHPDKAAPELWMNEVSVAPPHPGRGIGKARIAAVLGHAPRL